MSHASGPEPVQSATQQSDTPAKKPRAKGTKVFQCTGYPGCEMTFSRSEHLARHIRKHTGERPFHCHCGRTFSRLDNLRQHIQTVHANESPVFASVQSHSSATPQSPLKSTTPVSPYSYGLTTPVPHHFDPSGKQWNSAPHTPFSGGIRDASPSQFSSMPSAPYYTDSISLPRLNNHSHNHQSRVSVLSVASSASSVHSVDSSLSVGSTASNRSQTSMWLSSVLNSPDSPPPSRDADTQTLPSVYELLPGQDGVRSSTAGQSSVAIPQRPYVTRSQLISKPLPPLPQSAGQPHSEWPCHGTLPGLGHPNAARRPYDSGLHEARV